MGNISSSIAKVLEEHEIISESDVDKVKYGLDGFIITAFEIISILVIAAIVGNFWETVLLFLTFVPLRLYAGGYHADTKIKCYLISLAMYMAFTIVVGILHIKYYLSMNLIITIFSLIIILIAAPEIPKNKKVNDIERKYYRKFSINICILETVLIMLLAVAFPLSSHIVALAFGQCAVTVSIVAAKIKGKVSDNKQK